MVSSQGPRPPALFHERYATELLTASGLDAVVATSPAHIILLGGYGTWLDRQVRSWMYQPGGHDSARAGFAVLTGQGVTELAVSPLFLAEAKQAATADHVTPLARMRTSLLDDIASLARSLRSLGVADGHIGVELDDTPPSFLEHLAEALPNASIHEAGSLLRRLRTRKSPEMIRRLREVALLTESALRDLITLPIGEWQDRFRLSLAVSGADLDHVVYGLRDGGLGQTVPSGNPEAFYVDGGARRGHVVSDTGVTFARTIDTTLAAHYRVAREALLAGAAELRPGVRPADVHAAMRRAGESLPALVVQGHGIGLDIRELPAIAEPRLISHPSAHPSIETDMVINLEVAEFLEDGQSIQIEQSFLITPDGSEPLIATDRDHPWEYQGTPIHPHA